MEIKTSEGTYGVTGSGQGIYNTIAGSLGLASFLGINNGNGLLSGIGGNSSSNYVSKESFDLSMQLAAKNSEIAILQANADTDKKLVEVYEAAATRDNTYRDRLESQYRELDAKITEEREARLVAEGAQSVLNSQYQTGIAMLNGQVSSMQSVLNDITTSVIPSNKVCDTGCSCSNS